LAKNETKVVLTFLTGLSLREGLQWKAHIQLKRQRKLARTWNEKPDPPLCRMLIGGARPKKIKFWENKSMYILIFVTILKL
jgi:hypothetical protein